MTTSGLQLDRFVESFSPGDNNPTVVYATESFVNATVGSYLNTISDVTVKISDGLSIQNTIEGTNKTTVDIGLSAFLNDLNNVNANPGNYDYLQFIGSSWVAGPGLSVGSMNFLQLTNVAESTIPSGDATIFITNNIGSSLVFKTNNNLDTTKFSYGKGINITQPSGVNSANVEFNSLNLPATDSSDDKSLYQFVVYSPSNSEDRRASSLVTSSIDNFNTEVIDLARNSISINPASDYLTYSNATGHFALDSTTFLTGAGGVLGITRGGTSGTTALEARGHLGVSINTDVMGVPNPIFLGTMTGNNIILGPSSNVYSYLNFGTSEGETGLGFRSDGVSILEYRSDSGWTSLSGTSVGDLSDVGTSSFNDKDILVYSGTSFRGVSVTGAVTMDIDGVTTFTASSINLNQINFGTLTPSQGDFQTIVGISGISPSTLIEEFNDHILRTPNKNQIQNNQVLYAPGASGISGIITTHPESTNGFLYGGLTTLAPAWENVYKGFTLSSAAAGFGVGDIPDFNVPLLNLGTSQGEGYSVKQFNELITAQGVSNGLAINAVGYIEVNISELDTITDTNYNTLMVSEDTPSGASVRKKTFQNLFSESLNIDSGICVTASDKIRLNIPIGTSSGVSPASSLRTTEGSLIFLQNQDGAGTCYIAVSDGTSWFGAKLSLLS